MNEGWDAKPEDAGHDADALQQELDEMLSSVPLTEDDALRYKSVTEVAHLLRSSYLRHMFQRLSDYDQQNKVEENEDEGGATRRRPKIALVPEDPEYTYVSDCSKLVLRIEAEKSRVMIFLRAHYSIRFSELAMFISDFVLYAKVVSILKNSLDMEDVVEELSTLLPSQMLVVIISCASTTRGRELSTEELENVLEACQEMELLEMAKQTFLEYIQCSMPLVCPNLCALLDTGITSQLFAIAGSVSALAGMDSEDLIQLGSKRWSSEVTGGKGSAITVRASGFLSNADLIVHLPPTLRPKALRLLAGAVLRVARIDANRRAPSKDEGVRERRKCFSRIRQWLDPLVIRGAGHVLYERRNRKRRRQNQEE